MDRRTWRLLPAACLVALAGGCGGGDQRAPAQGEPDAPADTAPARVEAESLPAAATPFLAIQGFDSPESVLHDEKAHLYLVSNVNGPSTEKDDNGYISRVAPDGIVADRRWIAGGSDGVTLHAPKGMAIIGDSLFVADIDTVRIFNRVNGEPLGAWRVEGATFLNDVAAAPDGGLYVSDSGVRLTESGVEDTGSAGIFRFDTNGEITAVEAGDVTRVNGIAADGLGFCAVSYGPGTIFCVDAGGNRRDYSPLPGGSLDGIVLTVGGAMLISDWQTQAVYRVGQDGSVMALVRDVPSPADIDYDSGRGRLLVPSFMENRVLVYSMGR